MAWMTSCPPAAVVRTTSSRRFPPVRSDHEPALRLIAEEVCNHPIAECMGNVLLGHSVALGRRMEFA